MGPLFLAAQLLSSPIHVRPFGGIMSDDNRVMEEFVSDFHNHVRSELRRRCEAYKPDFKTPETFTAVSALICRQATLAIELASAPQLWNPHSAPLFLRARADVHITVSWILLDPTTRAKQYIEHGLGQAVLSLEHRKASLEELQATTSR